MLVRNGIVTACCAVLALTIVVSANGHVDQGRPTRNLQVLPKDWTTAEVQPVMQNLARAIGQQCTYCHEQDRASDAKPQKLIGRQMLQMTMAINDEYLKDVGTPVPEGEMKVTCFTCHRGELKPLRAPAGN